jgi:hypothetical protein
MEESENFSITGGSMSRGNSIRAASTFSRTLLVATSRSVPTMNSIATWDTPSWEEEVTFLMPAIVLTASSIGLVISVSISCGPVPG